MYDNVALWFAKDVDGDIITIDEVNVKNKDNTYSCPMCGSELIPKAIKNNSLVSSHFAHVDKSKCTGESMIHFWFKNKFLIEGDKFKVVSDIEKEYICKEILVEQSYEVDGKIYKPDVTVKTECGNTIYFEMNYSNKKKVEEYIDIWLGLKNIVVEVDIKSLMNKSEIPTFKALFYEGKELHTREDDLYDNTIGKYKKIKNIQALDENLKEEINRLDWLWEDVKLFKHGNKSIEYIFNMINLIESKDSRCVVVDILKSSMCNNILKEYIEFKKAYILDGLHLDTTLLKNEKYEINYKINIPYKIYERVYGGFLVEFNSGRTNIYKENTNAKISKDALMQAIQKTEYELIIKKQLKQYTNDKFGHFLNMDILEIQDCPSFSYRKMYDVIHFYNIPTQSIEYINLNTELYADSNKVIEVINSAIDFEKVFTDKEILDIEFHVNCIKEKYTEDHIHILGRFYGVSSLWIRATSDKYKELDVRISFKKPFESVDSIMSCVENMINVKLDIIKTEAKFKNIISYFNNKYYSFDGGYVIKYLCVSGQEIHMWLHSNRYRKFNNNNKLNTNELKKFINDEITDQEAIKILQSEIGAFIRNYKYNIK